jgi:hypothetical protein
MTLVISEKDLAAGDVLLSTGKSTTSLAIRTLDGGRYSHAALWTGDAVLESITPCVVERPLTASVAQQLYVDVYRYRDLGDRRDAVVRAGRRYVGRAYSFGDLALAAFLIATSTWIPKGEWQIRFLLDACELNRFFALDRPREGELVTCTELVARAYREADAPIGIVPRVDGSFDRDALFGAVVEVWRASRRAPLTAAPAPIEDWEAVRSRVRAKLRDLAGAASEAPSPGSLRGAFGTPPATNEAVPEWAVNLVTPHYLETSLSLERKGRIHGAPGAEELAPAVVG